MAHYIGRGRVSSCDLRTWRTDECIPFGTGRHDEHSGWQTGSGGLTPHQSSGDGCSATGLPTLQSIAEWQVCVGGGRQLNDCGSH